MPRLSKIKPTAAIDMDIGSKKRRAPQLWGRRTESKDSEMKAKGTMKLVMTFKSGKGPACLH